jgi:hypothetical protein
MEDLGIGLVYEVEKTEMLLGIIVMTVISPQFRVNVLRANVIRETAKTTRLETLIGGQLARISMGGSLIGITENGGEDFSESTVATGNIGKM